MKIAQLPAKIVSSTKKSLINYLKKVPNRRAFNSISAPWVSLNQSNNTRQKEFNFTPNNFPTPL